MTAASLASPSSPSPVRALAGMHAPGVAKYATVDEYIAALPEPLGKVAQHARGMIDANLKDADSAIR